MQACELKSLNRKVAKPLRLRKVRLQNIPPLAYSLRRRAFAVQLLNHLDFLNLSGNQADRMSFSRPAIFKLPLDWVRPRSEAGTSRGRRLVHSPFSKSREGISIPCIFSRINADMTSDSRKRGR